MPDVTVKYDGDEVRALIQADMKKRFGVAPSDDAISNDYCDSGGWSVMINTGMLDASKACHVAEDDDSTS